MYCMYCMYRRLDRQVSWGQYWNYLRRQLYVLDTYTNRHNRLINHTMMVVHSWASWAFAAPALMGEPCLMCFTHSSIVIAAAYLRRVYESPLLYAQRTVPLFDAAWLGIDPAFYYPQIGTSLP